MSLVAGLELRFHPDEKHFPTWYDDREQGPQHPCFIASGVHRSSGHEEYHCEFYQFYFKENLGIGLFRTGKKNKSMGKLMHPAILLFCVAAVGAAGYHKHDVEGVIVLFKKETQTPRWVYFKAHGQGQGEWKKWEECEKNEDGALVVYIAWGSHATYFRGENVTRIFGLANDAVSRKGRKIHVTLEDYVAAEEVKFAPGIMIYDTVQSIPSFSVSKAERVLLPLIQKQLKKRARK